MAETLLRVENLTKHFPIKGKVLRPSRAVQAVDGISFEVSRGETLGLVGESGCGKTTCGRTILRLYKPTGGRIIYRGEDIAGLSKRELSPYRKKMQMIFQDPYASLDPRMMVSKIISEGMDTSRGKVAVREEVHRLLDLVGLSHEHGNRFPHEFSGGQRQRIGIARALAVNPDFIVCDEPISSLDVSIQAQIVNMLEELQERLNLTYLFIAHDISMVKHISRRIGVMYLGKMVELGESNQLFSQPLHPYTKALLSAIPIPDPKASRASKRIVLEGDVPSPIDIPPGCRFRGRCSYVMDICGEKDPELAEVAPGYWTACWLYKK
jgi:oligopeptide transport system ATP-binding protein